MEDESPEHANFSPETLGGATARLLLEVGDPETVVQHAITAGRVRSTRWKRGTAGCSAENHRAQLPDLRGLHLAWRGGYLWLFEMSGDRESRHALAALDQAAELGHRTMTLLAGPPEQADLTVAGGGGFGAR